MIMNRGGTPQTRTGKILARIPERRYYLPIGIRYMVKARHGGLYMGSSHYAPETCADEQCQRHALTGSDYCWAHVQDKAAFVEKLVRSVMADAWLAGIDLAGRNFERADLRRVRLSGANLRGVNFRHADLRRAFLDEADLRGADFTGANLEFAVLGGANLSQARFCSAQVQRANLVGATGHHADFTGAHL